MAKQGESRHFMCMLYPETDSYDIESILLPDNLDSIFMEWSYCLHDLDTELDGVLKKEHIHLVGHLENATSIDSIANKLGIPKYHIKYAYNYRKAVRYLIHADDIEKYQYDVSDVQANFDFRKYLKDRECELKSRVIFQYIQDNRGLSLEQLVSYCMAKGLYSELRRGYSIFRDLLKGKV